MATKKRKRKLRFKLPRLNRQTTRRRRRRRRLRKEVYLAIAAALILAALIFVPGQIRSRKLKELGYDKTTIKEIRNRKLTKTIIENGYYSAYLADCIKDGSVNTDYLPLYNLVQSGGSLTADDFLLYNRLQDKGYEEEQVLNLFGSLRFWEMTPLLVFDYQYNEQPYIDDCKAHADVNSPSSFTLSGNYYTTYGSVRPTIDPDSPTAIVNKTYYLDSSFEPKNLTELSIYYAATGRTLSRTGADALAEWCDAGRNVGVTFYATSAYRPYDAQETVYNSYVQAWGTEEADRVSARPGHSEHQTGLVVDIAATNEDNVNDFSETLAYRWCSKNSADYGWILRYPEGKELITGYEFESWHYRYVGKDVALKLQESGLTYDEYYALYLKPFDDSTLIPKDDVLNQTNYAARTIEAEEE
ncbi:MAG: D-alanyl-D-alanine carboxypeptidase family protein [Solobacterium sp.]|nr:D-alanyl-D-alanine carboxypeptidase family protein [Solobacterium sp.]